MIKVRNKERLIDDDVVLPFQLNSVMIGTKRNLNWASNTSFSKSSCSKRSLRQDQILLTEESLKQSTNKKTSSSLDDAAEKAIDKVNFQIIASAFTNKKTNRKQEHFKLKNLIADQKIKLLVKNFTKKLKRNNTHSKPQEFYPFQADQQIGLTNMEGFQLDDKIKNLMAVLSVIQIVCLIIIYSLSIVFEQINTSDLVRNFQTISLIFYLIQIILNFVTIKQEQGKKLTKLNQIAQFYLKGNFLIDVASLVILIIDLCFSWYITGFLRLFIVAKLSQALQKIQKLQVSIITNFHKEQYWSLAKVFLFNFCYAHILAIALIAMSNLHEDNNWINLKHLNNSPWIQKYIWSYYWATNIMLTVGFGDICATTYQEAFVLTILQMISCMVLAYNINCIGTLISNIRSQDLEKSKNFKIFKNLSEKNNITEDLEWRINNYIQESSNIKKKFNYQEENNFIIKLPKGLKTQFLKESNKKIFQNLHFFKNLMEKTLFNFAQKIQMRICHPEEMIQNIDQNINLQILKGGSIGFCVKKSGCNFNTKVIDTIQILQKNQPYLIDLNFIRKNQKTFTIKSLEYSILYCLDYENIIGILKNSEMDYELYCLLRDKNSHIPDQFELFQCTLCKGNHTKFTCPKLHFVPICQQVINKYLFRLSLNKCKRTKQIGRIIHQTPKTLKNFLQMNMIAAGGLQAKNFTKSKKKIENFFISKKGNFEQIQHQSSISKEFEQIKRFFSQNTAELIKCQVEKMLKSQQSDQIWSLGLDKMKNYKSYFQQDNTSNLSQKFKLSRRKTSIVPQEDQNSFNFSSTTKKNISSKSIGITKKEI